MVMMPSGIDFLIRCDYVCVACWDSDLKIIITKKNKGKK